MGPTGVIMLPPCRQEPSQVVCRQGDHEIDTFPPQRAQQPLTERVRRWTVRWGFQDPEAQVPYALVELSGENTVPVMDEEARGVICWHRFAQLLQGPLCCGMRRDMNMEQAAAGVFHDHKDVEQTKGCCDGDTEVAGHDRLRMVAYKNGIFTAGHPIKPNNIQRTPAHTQMTP